MSEHQNPLVLVHGPNLYGAMQEKVGEKPRFHEGRLREILLGDETAPRESTRYYSFLPGKQEKGGYSIFLYYWMTKMWRVRAKDGDTISVDENMLKDADDFLGKSRNYISRLVLVCASKNMASVADAYRAAGIPVTIVSKSGAFLAPAEGDQVIPLDDIIPQIRLREDEIRERRNRKRFNKPEVYTRPAVAAE